METETPVTLITESVAELVALATAMAANNPDAFQQANSNLEALGVSREDRIKVVNLALRVKMLPHNNLMDMATGYLAGGGCGGSCGGDCEEGGCGEEGCGCGHDHE
ncbi:MAG: hypothetical protein P4L36_07350 [Holophaga sp.]|nr:hypothetical protein [Holophaga sp.]